MVIFATAGKPESFKGKYPQDLPAYLSKFGLNGYEVQCGRGVNISDETVDFFKNQKELKLSLHAPYYISISGIDEAIREKSVDYILESAKAAQKIGAERIVVHAGSCAKITREQAMELAAQTLKKSRKLLNEQGLCEIKICLETMGKANQLGTLEEVLQLCKTTDGIIPCIDFGHLNARTGGVIKNRADYAEILNKIEAFLGKEILHNLHIHFSKIEYTAKGEKKHLTFQGDLESDKPFGPDYKPLMQEIAARGMQPFIVCESDGTQAEDCAEMAEYYKEL
jgi:deoxyribonuclease-4